MTKARDLSGQQFGRLTAVLRHGEKWLCRCECGAEKLVLTYNMTSGHTQSCGCLHREVTSETSARHRLVGTATYNSWASMKARCTNPKNPRYAAYGGRGITYPSEWETFVGFYADMGDCPDGMSIDREDNNLSYSKDNCRWATATTQANNTRRTMHIEFAGQRKSVTQWAKSLGMNQPKLQKRLAKGWSVEKALTTP